MHGKMVYVPRLSVWSSQFTVMPSSGTCPGWHDRYNRTAKRESPVKAILNNIGTCSVFYTMTMTIRWNIGDPNTVSVDIDALVLKQNLHGNKTDPQRFRNCLIEFFTDLEHCCSYFHVWTDLMKDKNGPTDLLIWFSLLPLRAWNLGNIVLLS